MIALCLVSLGWKLTGASIFFLYIAIFILLASPMVMIYALWRIFVPPRDLPATNLLRLDPEAEIENRARFCWSGIPIWKLALYAVLTVMTLIY